MKLLAIIVVVFCIGVAYSSPAIDESKEIQETQYLEADSVEDVVAHAACLGVGSRWARSGKRCCRGLVCGGSSRKKTCIPKGCRTKGMMFFRNKKCCPGLKCKRLRCR